VPTTPNTGRPFVYSKIDPIYNHQGEKNVSVSGGCSAQRNRRGEGEEEHTAAMAVTAEASRYA
jgi:hypothetical protein